MTQPALKKQSYEMSEPKREEPLLCAQLVLWYLQRSPFPSSHSHPALLLLTKRICFLCTHPASAWLRCCTKCSAADSFQHFTGHLASTRLPLSKGSSPTLGLPSGQLHPCGHTPLEPSLCPRVALIVFTPSLASKRFQLFTRIFLLYLDENVTLSRWRAAYKSGSIRSW